ncbi:MAG: GNAT family N-acetyltransferase [Clostridiaceae bacterium]
MRLDRFEIMNLDREDFNEASKLILNVFSEFEAPDYLDEGVENFKDFIDSNKLYKNMKSGFMNFWGCFDKGNLIGVIASREVRHVSLLFVKKEYHRMGIARKLFNELKKELIKNNPHIEAITVNSSPFAVKIYERLGFIAIGDEIVKDGLRFTPMKYML